MKRMKMDNQYSKTFGDGYEEYVLDMKARNLRDGTIHHYEQSIIQIFKRVSPNIPIADMDERTMPDFIIALRDSGTVNDVSIGTYARDLKTLMRFFMKKGYLKRFDIHIPKADKEPIETYTDHELSLLLKKPNLKKCTFPHYRSWVIINLIMSTGLRQNSIINIKIKDVDIDNAVLYVHTTKNRKPLIIPLNLDITMILKDYLRYRNGEDDDWLFCNHFGKKLVKSTIYHGIWDFCHQRGVNKTGIHRFRHTFAKKWITMGGSVVTLQKILGHSSLDITENYIHMLTSDLKKEIDDINIIKSFSSEFIKMK